MQNQPTNMMFRYANIFANMKLLQKSISRAFSSESWWIRTAIICNTKSRRRRSGSPDVHRKHPHLFSNKNDMLFQISSCFQLHTLNISSLAKNSNVKGSCMPFRTDHAVNICHGKSMNCITARFYAKKVSKSKGKGKKPSIDVQGAEGIVDLNGMQQKMQDVIDEMGQELATKVPLRITTGYIDNIMVDTGKGKKVPLYQVAQVQSQNDLFRIEVQDTFPNAVKLIATAVAETGFNMQPQIKGTTITIPIPLFTHDQKGAVEKIAKGIANQAKDGLRKVRQKGMIDIRNNKEGQSKDLIRRIENQVQQITDYWTEKVDLAYEQKVKEIGGRKSK